MKDTNSAEKVLREALEKIATDGYWNYPVKESGVSRDREWVPSSPAIIAQKALVSAGSGDEQAKLKGTPTERVEPKPPAPVEDEEEAEQITEHEDQDLPHGEFCIYCSMKKKILAFAASVRQRERERCASLHESISPACDHEKAKGSPGAGAIGAILEYRDKIRSLKRQDKEPQMKRGYKTWGNVFRAALRRGLDHGYAAYLADRWEKRRGEK